MVIDIHSHIKWSHQHQEELEQQLLFDMERNHIDKRVVSCIQGTDMMRNNQYISDFVAKYPSKLIGCGVINPKDPDCEKHCEKLLQLQNIKMVEFNSLEHSYYPDVCENVEKVFEILKTKRVPVKIFSGIGAYAMPHQWIKYVEKYPEISFIFLHMGCFDYGYGCVDFAVKYPNVYLETSNQYEVQILKKSLAVVPKEKLLFGSLYPERLTKCSLHIYNMFSMEEDKKRLWLGENAALLFNI